MSKNSGALIREARLSAGMTQVELANAVEGISASTISKAERGVRELKPEQLQKIADATGVTYESLLVCKDETAVCETETVEAAETTEATPETEETVTAEAEARLTDEEKEVLDLYNSADAEQQKEAEATLKGDKQQAQVQNPMAMLAGMLGGMMGNNANGENGANPMAAMMGGEGSEGQNPMAMLAGMLGGMMGNSANGENGANPMAAMMGGEGSEGQNPMAMLAGMLGGIMGNSA
ncbi:MAG: helix-turn-helix domain-containing protein, partial [Lachnospiraceae bacterium]|nr:helix-turn-helix domain-containing protein [Lachnospiraceae bacterium]